MPRRYDNDVGDFLDRTHQGPQPMIWACIRGSFAAGERSLFREEMSTLVSGISAYGTEFGC
jgi:hypothetical protein